MSYEFIEDEPQESSILGNIFDEGKRHLERTGSNISTRLLGTPGDIFSLINDYIAGPTVSGFTGQKAVPYEETILSKGFPTTESLRQRNQAPQAQNEVEKFVDDVVEDTAMLFSPSKIGKYGVKGLNFFKNLAKSLGANFLGETAKQNISEESSPYVKAGSLFLTSLLDQESAAKQVGKLYQEAEKNLPSTAKISAHSLNKNLDSLAHTITKGRPYENLSAPERFVIDQINKVKNLTQTGEINIHQAIAQKRSLNKELATLYKEVPGGKEQKNVKNLAKQITGYLGKTIEDYGKTNKAFYKPYKDADQAFGTLANSNFVSSWIEKNLTQHPVINGLAHMFAVPIKMGAAAILPYQVTKLTYRISKSPTLAKIYAKTMKAAANEDKLLFNKYFKELDQALQDEESEDRFEFID